MTLAAQPTLPGIPPPGNMPDGWVRSPEPPRDHMARTGHRIEVGEDDTGTAWVYCDACEIFWYAGVAHHVDRYTIAVADRLCRGRKPDVR